MDPQDIVQLLNVVLNTTYFQFRGEVYQQCHGAAMGSPVSPIVANLYMEHFEELALSTAPNPPKVWKRYVDDTFAICSTEHVDEFTDHINSVDMYIKFTRELEKDSCIAFLDTLVTRKQDGSISLSIYRKPTHTNQYLNFKSHHPLHQKLGVVRTLYQRCDRIVTNESEKKQEHDLIASSLASCGYPKWTHRGKSKAKTDKRKEQQSAEAKNSKVVTIPYCSGLSEKLNRIFGKHNTRVASKPERTIRDILVKPKDRTPQDQQCGAIYKIPCADCDAFYIGETGRQLNTRIGEHKKSVRLEGISSAVGEHQMDTGHDIAWKEISVLGIESKDYPRKIREAIEIRTQHPLLNRDQGMELPALYNRVLNTRSLGHIPQAKATHTSERSHTTGTSSGGEIEEVAKMPSGGQGQS